MAAGLSAAGAGAAWAIGEVGECAALPAAGGRTSGSVRGAFRIRTAKRWRVDLLSTRGTWVSPKNSQLNPATCAKTDAMKEIDPRRGGDCGRVNSVIIGAGFMVGESPACRHFPLQDKTY